MRKLYKKIDHVWHYWEIWEDGKTPAQIIIHWGVLGEMGENVRVNKPTLEDALFEIVEKVAEKKESGYQEMEELSSMVLQFQTDDSWGDTEDLDFRTKMSDRLDGILGWTGNGSVTGGDIGSGTINIFFEVLDARIAVRTIVSAFEYLKIDKKYLIALQPDEADDEEDDSGDPVVLYPADYSEEFNY